MSRAISSLLDPVRQPPQASLTPSLLQSVLSQWEWGALACQQLGPPLGSWLEGWRHRRESLGDHEGTPLEQWLEGGRQRRDLTQMPVVFIPEVASAEY